MIYCDTSLLASALLANERHSHAAQIWLASQPAGELAISRWVHTELASAIALRVRRRDLDQAAKARVLLTWEALLPAFDLLPVEPHHFEHAAALVLKVDATLRGGDALHLAIALDRGCALATFDHDLHAAAMRHGVAVPVLP